MILACAPIVPAGAAQSVSTSKNDSVATAKKKREQLRQERAKAAAKLNAMKASDVQLEKAVNALRAQANAQMAKVASARQAANAAQAAVVQADGRLAATEAELGSLRTAVTERAVAAYVRPRPGVFQGLSGAKDLSEASRRHSLLAQVANNDHDVIDRLNAAKEDQGIEQARAAEARQLAADRRKKVEGELSSLQRSLAEKGRLERALSQRIKEFQAEVDGLASQEAAISAVIKSREGRTRPLGGGIDVGKISGAGLMWPVGGSVTSGFGTRWGRLHAGIDISARTGTPIRAAKAGEVIMAGSQGGYGNVVIVDHGGGLTTLYAHQSRIAARDGQQVAQGEVLGYVGSTGHSTGPHLHFETRVGGSPQNPRRMLP